MRDISESIKNIEGAEASEKIKELADAAKICLMMTALDKRPLPVRPMAIQKTDDMGRMYFLSHKNSEKNADLIFNNEMHITISNNGNSEYLSLYGKADVYRDQHEIDELYSKLANNWFEGKDDPNITIIRFEPESGHYWDTKHGKVAQLAGMLVGAITGKQGDDGIEGHIRK
jgi:general stress protein 26